MTQSQILITNPLQVKKEDLESTFRSMMPGLFILWMDLSINRFDFLPDIVGAFLLLRWVIRLGQYTNRLSMAQLISFLFILISISSLTGTAMIRVSSQSDLSASNFFIIGLALCEIVFLIQTLGWMQRVSIRAGKPELEKKIRTWLRWWFTLNLLATLITMAIFSSALEWGGSNLDNLFAVIFLTMFAFFIILLLLMPIKTQFMEMLLEIEDERHWDAVLHDPPQ